MMDRRSMFRALVGVQVAAGAAVALPAASVVDSINLDSQAPRIIQLALIRLGVLQIGEEPDLKTTRFCWGLFKSGMDDSALAEALRPYFPVSAPPAERYGHTAPQECVLCGNATMSLLSSYVLHPQRVYRCCGIECPNRWPWLQSGVTQKRVSPEALRLFAVVDRMYAAEYDALEAVPYPASWHGPYDEYLRLRVLADEERNKIKDIAEKQRYEVYGLIIAELKKS